MPKIGQIGKPEQKPVCKACGGTGRNSKGRECYPCDGKGYLQLKHGGSR